jgi:hypothetical protein
MIGESPAEIEAEKNQISAYTKRDAGIAMFESDELDIQSPILLHKIKEFGINYCGLRDYYSTVEESNNAAAFAQVIGDPEEPMVEFTSFMYGVKMAHYVKRNNFKSHGERLPQIDSLVIEGVANAFNDDIATRAGQQYLGNYDEFFETEYNGFVEDAALRRDIKALQAVFHEDGSIILNDKKFMAGAAYIIGLYERYQEVQDLKKLL